MPALVNNNSYMNKSLKTVNIQLSTEPQSSLEFLSLSEPLFNAIYGSSGNVQNKYISVRMLGSNILLETRVYPITIKRDLPKDTVELESLRLFQDYGSDFTVEKCIIRPISRLPHLTSIVMTFPSEVYDLLQNYPRSKLLELLAQERESSTDFIILRKDDISHSLNGKIIHAEPFDQGYINEDSVITIVKQSSDSFVNNISNDEEEDFEPFDVDMIQDSIILNSTPNVPITFKVDFLNSNILKDYTHFTSNDSQFLREDEQLFAGVSSADLQRLHCLSGDIVKLQSSPSANPIYIRIFPFIDPNSFTTQTIYLSPILLLSLSNPKEVSITLLSEHNTQRADLPRHKLSKFISLSKDVILARVAAPTTLDRTLQYLFLSNLKSYFGSAYRVVTKGQLIPIALDSYLARSLFETYDSQGKYPEVIPQGKSDTIAWFKVSDGKYEDEVTGDLKAIEEGKQYIFNPYKTRMIQSGVVKESLKDVNISQISEYLQVKTDFSFDNKPLPQGKNTFEYAKRLRKIFDTSFKTRDKIQLQTTILLTSSTRSIGKSTLVRSISKDFGVSFIELDGFELISNGLPSQTVGTIRGKLDRMVDSCDRLIIYIKHVEALCKKGDPQQQDQKSLDDSLSLKMIKLIEEYTNNGVIFIASTNNLDGISDIFRSKIKFEIDVTVPTEAERALIFQKLINFNKNDVTSKNKHKFVARQDVSIGTLALQSAGLTPNDIVSIVSNVKNGSMNRLEDKANELNLSINELILLNGGVIKLTPKDFEESINNARNKFSDSIGAPRIPNVKWEDVGGLDLVKDEILDTIEMPLKHPELFGSGMKKRSGILFYGPPGTGKTLLAKAIATNFALNFFSVKGPELLNMYIGESEANVRRVFEKARDAKPCVIFFDELDSVAPKRGNQGDSGGVMDRIVSQLLAELDGMSGGEDGDGVFVVGASNRPDLLDEALLRPGRFDKMLYLGISDTHDKQAKIIEALTRKFKTDPKVDLTSLANSCPFNFTGADFYALCSDAMLNAMTRTAGQVDAKIKSYNEDKDEKDKINTRHWFENVASKEDVDVLVTKVDFDKARKDLVPSVSSDELQHYLNVRANFEGGKK